MNDQSRGNMLIEYEKHAEYDAYLAAHFNGIQNGYAWLLENWPELLETGCEGLEVNLQKHDASKRVQDEYPAYAAYHFSKTKVTAEVEAAYRKAKLHHFHNNPHHWNHWVYVDDNNNFTAVEIPKVYVVEMILDWWSFSWRSGDLREIRRWYRDNKNKIVLHPNTRVLVEEIINGIMHRLGNNIKKTIEEHQKGESFL